MDIGVGSLLLPCEILGSEPKFSSWQQAPLPQPYTFLNTKTHMGSSMSSGIFATLAGTCAVGDDFQANQHPRVAIALRLERSFSGSRGLGFDCQCPKVTCSHL